MKLYCAWSVMVAAGVMVCAAANFARAGDCNMNGIPDDEDIADCMGDPDCDDCNLNTVPDECDIDAMTSSDVNMDGVPDECVDTSAVGNNWTDDIWGLGGNYPDNDDGVPNLYVSLYGAEIFLDETVTIPSLRILDGSTLDITQTGLEGDLNITHPVQPGNPDALLIRGDTGGSPVSSLMVGDGRTISVSGGAVHVAEGGRYEAAGAVVAGGASMAQANNSQLEAEDVTIDEGMVPGTIVLSQTMQLTASGSVTLEGVAALGSTSCTPPIFNLSGSVVVEIAADMNLKGTADTTNTSTMSVQLGGDWNNQSLDPQGFDWTAGKLTMGDGVVAGSTAGGLQIFETAGQNFGPNGMGFVDNFAMDTLEVAPAANVSFVDAFDNDDDGQSACSEALYVDTLILGAGATVTVTDTRIYCNTLINSGASVTPVGCGAIVAIIPPPPPIPAVSEWGIVAMVLLTLTAATIIHSNRGQREGFLR